MEMHEIHQTPLRRLECNLRTFASTNTFHVPSMRLKLKVILVVTINEHLDCIWLEFRSFVGFCAEAEFACSMPSQDRSGDSPNSSTGPYALWTTQPKCLFQQPQTGCDRIGWHGTAALPCMLEAFYDSNSWCSNVVYNRLRRYMNSMKMHLVSEDDSKEAWLESLALCWPEICISFSKSGFEYEMCDEKMHAFF